MNNNEIENSQAFKNIIISSNKSINDLTKEQEKCLLELIKKKETGFQNEWEYLQWHRYAVALELSQTDRNDIYINNKAMWSFLINNKEQEKPEGIREWIIFLIHNFLEEQFTKARIEMGRRENEQEIE